MTWFFLPLLAALSIVNGAQASEHRFPIDFTGRSPRGQWSGEFSQVPGEPRVPVHYFRWVVPQGERVTEVSLTALSRTASEKMTFPTNPIPKAMCSSPVRRVSARTYTAGQRYQAMDDAIIVDKLGYQILVVPVFPVAYYPADRRGSFSEAVEVTVTTEEGETSPLFRGLPEDRAAVELLAGESEESRESLDSYPTSLSEREAERIDYLVIGPESYLHQDALLMFLSEKTARGIVSSFRTLEDIQANVSGASVTEKVRNAIKEAYTNNGLKYALLVGNGYSTLPTKKVSVDGESIGTDMYFGCLDSGEDFACEVAIGRAPASSNEEFQRFLMKSLQMSLMDSSDPSRLSELNFGETMDSSTLGSKCVDQLLTGGKAGSITTQGYPAAVKATKLYETQAKTFSASEVIDAINKGGFFTINHLGHANETYCMRFKTSDMAKLTNPLPFFAITQGCHPGDLSGPNWAATLIIGNNAGAGAVIANSSYGWYNPGSNDGPSNRHHLTFYDTVFAEKIDQLGKANFRAKERLIPQLSGNSTLKKVVYETNLFGDPELRLRIPQ